MIEMLLVRAFSFQLFQIFFQEWLERTAYFKRLWKYNIILIWTQSLTAHFFFRIHSWVSFSGFSEAYNEVFSSEVEKYAELVGGNYTQLFLTPILFDLLHTQYIVCFVGYCFFLQPVVLSKKTKKTSLA